MKKSIMLEKGLAIGAIFLFLFVAINSVTGVSCVYKPLNKGEDPIPVIEGIKGENNWYISQVVISFSFDPKVVDQIKYYYQGTWHIYEIPFTIDEDGIHSIDWYWIDEDGKRHDGNPIYLMIDITPPTITLTKQIGTGQITFTAACSDTTSEVKEVEFYLDDELVETIGEKPYSYVWIGAGIHTVQAIGYNFAGLSAESDILDTTPKSKTMNFQFLEILIQRIYNLFLIIQQMV